MNISTMDGLERTLLGLDSDTFYIYHVAAVMVDNLRRLLLGINLSDKAIMDLLANAWIVVLTAGCEKFLRTYKERRYFYDK